MATEFNQFFNQAKEYGLINSIFSLRVNAMKDENAPIRLHADSDDGNGLLSILDGDDSLYDVRVIDEELSDVREELHDEIEANLVYEQYSDVDELFDDIKEMTKSLAGTKISFFCPLAGNLNDHEGDYYEADGSMLTDNIDKIEDAIRSEQALELKDDGVYEVGVIVGGETYTFKVTIDTLASYTANVHDGGFANSVTVKADENVTVSVTKNGEAFTYELGKEITEPAKYTVKVTDAIGNTSEFSFTIVEAKMGKFDQELEWRHHCIDRHRIYPRSRWRGSIHPQEEGNHLKTTG